MPSLGRLGDVVVNVRASTSKLRGDLANARGQVRNSMSSLGGVARVGLSFLGAAVVGGLMAALTLGVKTFFDRVSEGAQIQSWAEAIGESIEKTSTEVAVAKLIGVDPQEVIDAIISMQQILGEALRGDEGALRLLQELGLNLEDLRRMSPVEQLQAFISALQRIEDPAQRAKLAAELFGEGGIRELGRRLGITTDELEGLQNKVNELGLTYTEEQVKMAQETIQTWNEVKAITKQPFVWAANGLLPVVLGGLKELQKFLGGVKEGFLWIKDNAGAIVNRANEIARQAAEAHRRSLHGQLIEHLVMPAAGAVINPIADRLARVAEYNRIAADLHRDPSSVNIHYGDVYGVDDFNDRVNEGIRAGDRSGLPRARGNN